METIFDIKELRKDLVTKRVIELNIGLREAATLIGTSSATLSRIENAKICDVETFAKCCIWLETKPEQSRQSDVSGSLIGFMNWLWINHNDLRNSENNKEALKRYLATL